MNTLAYKELIVSTLYNASAYVKYRIMAAILYVWMLTPKAQHCLYGILC